MRWLRLSFWRPGSRTTCGQTVVRLPQLVFVLLNTPFLGPCDSFCRPYRIDNNKLQQKLLLGKVAAKFVDLMVLFLVLFGYQSISWAF